MNSQSKTNHQLNRIVLKNTMQVAPTNTGKKETYNDRVNRAMTAALPELESSFSLCPMAFDNWRQPHETVDNGDPCFIPSTEDLGRKQDYIYVPRPRDKSHPTPGYYHFRTQEAHVEAYHRWLAVPTPRRPAIGLSKAEKAQQRQERQTYFDVKRVLLNRTWCPEPDDLQAARLALVNTQSAGSTKKAAAHSTLVPALTTSLLLSLGR